MKVLVTLLQGLRITLLMGAFGTALGAWIKVIGVAPHLFSVALFGQTVTAMSQVFILGVPPNVAAVWFGAEQVSSACSIGVFGNQVRFLFPLRLQSTLITSSKHKQFGIALGFLLPPIMVQNHENIDDIGADLRFMSYIIAGVCTALFLIVLIGKLPYRYMHYIDREVTEVFITGFQAKPPLPPNPARSMSSQSSGSMMTYCHSIKNIVTNRNYILLLITYGINAGVFYAMSTLLNQTVLRHFPVRRECSHRF